MDNYQQNQPPQNRFSQQPPKTSYQFAPEQLDSEDDKRLFKRIFVLFAVTFFIIPVNFFIWLNSFRSDNIFFAFKTLAIAQLVVGIICAVEAFKYVNRRGANKAGAILFGLFGTLVGLGGPVAIFLDSIVRNINLNSLGGAGWGRPLRVRGKIVRPDLHIGDDWAAGRRPNTDGLDEDTKKALEALWLHDAQKEHASVPAFSRISWQLTALGAPAYLLEGAHRAAIQEIDHARRCLALAAGYGGRTHTVEPMPELLAGGLDLTAEPFAAMAVESLKDGCLLEGYNADIAQKCFEVCQDDAARDVLNRIAREERSHEEFSWKMLEWLLARGGASVQRAVANAITEMQSVSRPTAVSTEKAALVAKANPEMLKAHGRIPDDCWAQPWIDRLAKTEQQARDMLANCQAHALIVEPAQTAGPGEDCQNGLPLINMAAQASAGSRPMARRC